MDFTFCCSFSGGTIFVGALAYGVYDQLPTIERMWRRFRYDEPSAMRRAWRRLIAKISKIDVPWVRAEELQPPNPLDLLGIREEELQPLSPREAPQVGRILSEPFFYRKTEMPQQIDGAEAFDRFAETKDRARQVRPEAEGRIFVFAQRHGEVPVTPLNEIRYRPEPVVIPEDETKKQREVREFHEARQRKLAEAFHKQRRPDPRTAPKSAAVLLVGTFFQKSRPPTTWEKLEGQRLASGLPPRDPAPLSRKRVMEAAD